MYNIPYGKHYIDDDDIRAVVKVLQSDFVTQGPEVKAFEEEFATYVGAKYAVAVSSGTAALHIAAIAMGVTDEVGVIVPTMSFVASANCVQYARGRTELCDVSISDALIDTDMLCTKLKHSKKKFNGIVAVDFAGMPVNLEQLKRLADEYGMWIIEDASHALGGSYVNSEDKVQYCGNCCYADIGIFSFHPVKHIACGEGGMITTTNEKVYKRLLRLRNHGITRERAQMKYCMDKEWYYEMQELGYNYRLSDIHSALGRAQLGKAKEWLQKRKSIAKRYDAAFSDSPIRALTGKRKHDGHAYHLYIVLVENRNQFYSYLRAHNIFAQVHYIPIHLQPYYRERGYRENDFPQAEKFYKQCISLPIYPSLSYDEQTYVIETCLQYYQIMIDR